jgi:hypothetical protein
MFMEACNRNSESATRSEFREFRLVVLISIVYSIVFIICILIGSQKIEPEAKVTNKIASQSYQ